MASMLFIAGALIALAASASAQGNATCNTLALTRWTTTRAVKNHTLESLTNADATYNGVAPFPNFSLTRVTLAPCGVREMHTHIGVDEMIYILNGTVSAATAWQNGTFCEQSILVPGQAYAYPNGLLHTAHNPSCTQYVQYLGFFTAFNSNTLIIGAGAANLPFGPFKAYTEDNKQVSLTNATDTTTLVYDPLCLKRCNLGTQGGQLPAS